MSTSTVNHTQSNRKYFSPNHGNKEAIFKTIHKIKWEYYAKITIRFTVSLGFQLAFTVCVFVCVCLVGFCGAYAFAFIFFSLSKILNVYFNFSFCLFLSFLVGSIANVKSISMDKITWIDVSHKEGNPSEWRYEKFDRCCLKNSSVEVDRISNLWRKKNVATRHV